ncbi:hypothetical protein [Modicisalibacter tunisiensis]|uniref:DUF3106 domain-containing protein n=1 Tax=Modicisalibacter tunisiensis TaxID=390637 RepID=A0ABS7X152_9GAMM|nr:hypothetical protein [Modicisalibacter tunisiensis]MBZ9537968.1 hypothetical protein [Modicisalibacter tunisiensis]MBZ9568615.1 hypothetical protein [Modicisalibacter tunisiensis]
MRPLFIALLAATLASPVLAQDQDRDRDQDRIHKAGATQTQDQLRDRDQTRLRDRDPDGQSIYGWQIMSREERQQYQQQMHDAQGATERQRLREEHHRLMQERARKQGVTLPESRSKGWDKKRNHGGGMGSGMN